MSRYLVTLNPIGSFFFGSERTLEFNDGESKLRNNIVKSTYFPQQTSILGMLRKEILNKKKLLQSDWNYDNKHINVNEIYKCIGRESFSLESKNQSFGWIKNISPVFIGYTLKNNILMKIPKDHNKEKDHYTPLKFSRKSKCKCNFTEEDLHIPVDFDNKKGISEDFIDIKTGEITKKDEIFKVDNLIGINIGKNHTTTDGSLFRLVKFRFKSDKIFIFTVDIDCENNSDFKDYKNVVKLGGENSYFNIYFREVSSDFDIDIKVNKNCTEDSGIYKKIILLSDTYIKSCDYDRYCIYSISDSVDFRNLSSKSYTKRSNKFYYREFSKSYKYTLLERGSVLYTTDKNYSYLISSIKNKHLQQIGYNKFI